MKIKLTLLGFITCVFSTLLYQSCVYNDQTKTFSTTVTPQNLPIVSSGFNFPEDSNTIYKWLGAQDTVSIANHAWGIWAGLTAPSNQIYNGDTLLIYQTWLGIGDIANACANGQTQDGCGITKNMIEKLDFPRQNKHAAFLGALNQGIEVAEPDTNLGFLVSVAYNPYAACFATTNSLLNQSKINSYVVAGKIGRIPSFPNNAITIKPTYFLGKTVDGLIRIPAWQGPASNQFQVYGPSSWNSYIFVDVSNKQSAGKIAKAVVDGEKDQALINNATVNLNEFISYPLDSTAAAFINEQQGQQVSQAPVVAGDLAILVAMHVTTKEISNWTWQTYFWTTDPANPAFPSSSWQASLGTKAGLSSAAAHYAVSTSYAMVWPNQPITNGTNIGVRPIIGYNPYLEPGLPAPFGNINNLNSTYQYGMQTNCMSCHVFAALNKNTPYSADQYVDLNDTIFNNAVMVDFAWSIQQNINKNK